ncbi:MAG: carbohydrate ABC transporter permease [Actinomycetota bacterium]
MARTNVKFSMFKYTMLLLVAIFVLYPVYYMITLSFRTQGSLFTNQTLLPASDSTLDNYRAAFASTEFTTSLKNSVIVCSSATIISIVFGVMAAYALTILKFKGRDTMGRVIIIAFLTPGALLFIPFAVIMANLSLSNSLRGLVLVYLSFMVPLSTYLLLGFFKSLPPELEQAARIDGANRLQALWYVLVPLVAPGLISVAIITFTGAYNELLYSLVINVSPEVRTVPVAILNLSVADEVPWGRTMAYSSIAAIPIMAIYFLGQRFVVEGLQTGSVKG